MRLEQEHFSNLFLLQVSRKREREQEQHKFLVRLTHFCSSKNLLILPWKSSDAREREGHYCPGQFPN